VQWKPAKGTIALLFQLHGKAIIHSGKKQKNKLDPLQYIISVNEAGPVRLESQTEKERCLLLLLSTTEYKKLKKELPGLSPVSGRFMDSEMHTAAEQIMVCSFEGKMKQLYLQAKVQELLVLVAERNSRPPAAVYIKNEYDQERILFARDYLLQRITMPPTIPELARISGINEFKLKMGFKELFNNTVYGYLSEERLQIAKKELSGTKTLTEIAFELGYSSNQHFSMAFRKKFGVSPNKLRRG
jgi:AraC-like DNA-binding protein